MEKLTLIDISGYGFAKSLFEFLATPGVTKVEWTHAKIGSDEYDRNIVGTSHKEGSSRVDRFLFRNNYKLLEVNHNHPKGSNAPSKADSNTAKEYYEKFKNDIILHIYTHSGNYFEYNQHGPVINLPEINVPVLKNNP
jgi:hypothetical protein